MARPPLEVGDLVRAAGEAFLERNRHWLRWKHIKVLLAIRRCRTAALGGHLDECTRCGHRAPISYNSCRDRHCPKCQTAARDRCTSERTSPDPLPACGLHTTRPVGSTGTAEQEAPLRSAVPHQCRNSSRSGSRSEASWCRDWFLQRVAHLESATQNSSACPLCRSRRRPLARSHPLGSFTRQLLSSQGGAA